jgi:hypothetical protein
VQGDLSWTPAWYCNHHVGHSCQRGVVCFGHEDGRKTQASRFGENGGHFFVRVSVGKNKKRIPVFQIQQLIGKHRAGDVERPTASPHRASRTDT